MKDGTRPVPKGLTILPGGKAKTSDVIKELDKLARIATPKEKEIIERAKNKIKRG